MHSVFLNTTFLQSLNNYKNYHQNISTLIPDLIFAIKNLEKFYFTFQVPFEKIVLPFFMEHETFLIYSQTIKKLMSVVDKFYKPSELYNVIENKNLELTESVYIDKKIESVFRRDKLNVHFLKKAKENLYFLKISFQLLKKASEQFDNDYLVSYFHSIVYNGMILDRDLTTFLQQSYPFLFDFFNFFDALQRMAILTDKYNEFFNSFFYVEVFNLIMDLRFSQTIDIPMFISKFSEKIIGGLNLEKFSEITQAVMDEYIDLLAISLNFFHRGLSPISDVSKIINRDIGGLLFLVDNLISFLKDNKLKVNLQDFFDKFEDFFEELNETINNIVLGNLNYLFSEDFFIKLNDLIFLIPELKNLANNLRSVRDIAEFLNTLKTHYFRDLRILRANYSYLLKVLENFKAFLQELEQAFVFFFKELQQSYAIFQNILLFKILPFYNLKQEFVNEALGVVQSLIDDFNDSFFLILFD